jgi:hypothetical protein
LCKSNLAPIEYATIHIEDDNIDITDKDDLKNFKIESSCYVNDNFIGTAVAKKITVEMFNNGQYELENKKISVKTGIEIDGKIEYTPMGTFIIEKPTTEEVSTKTQFVGYDYMIKFNATYVDRVTYPIKTVELLKDLCNQVGVECGITEFTNSNYMILGNPFTNNEDSKTVLSNIAQLAGGFAYIGRNNKLYIKTLETTDKLLRVKDIHFMSVADFNNTIVNTTVSSSDIADEKIDGNNYFEFSKNNKFGKVNSLILRLSQVEGENTVIQDEDSIKKDGLTEITIADNYFLTSNEEREKVIDALWNKLKGLEYLPFEIKDYGFPYLDLGDMICIKDTEDNEYISYVFDYTFNYNGIYSGNLKANALTKTQTAFKNTNNIKTKFRNVEYKVDKINGTISSIVSTQEEISKDLKDTSTTANNNYQDILNKLGDKAQKDDVVALEKTVQAVQDDSKYAITVTEDIKLNGVSKVKTDTGYTFDKDGLKIEKTNAKTKSKLNEAGLEITDATGSNEESLLFAGYDDKTGETIVKSKNMTVEKYLTIGTYSRIEDYQEGTGVFWIGGND